MSQPKVRNLSETEDLQVLETLLPSVRRAPGEFRTAAAMAAFAGLGEARLEALFRCHLHRGPGAFLEEARVAAACRMLLGHFGPGDAAGERCGFATPAIFHARFHRATGMTPGRYQDLGREGAGFTLDLPPGYRMGDILAYHGRDPLSLSERVQDGTLFKALALEGGAMTLELALQPARVKVKVHTTAAPTPGLLGEVHRRVARMLGLGLDPATFEASLEGDPEFRALVEPRRGLRIPLTPDVWESLVWAILGQQVNLAFAYALRRRLTELCGPAAPLGLLAHPCPAAVAALEPAALAPLQFSRSKAEYLIQAAREVASGGLPLEALAEGAATMAEAALSSRRGIGPWTTHYVMMRGCGFGDCVPLGDSGLTAALQRHFRLDHRPDAKETASLMAPYAPHRSLATFHLWASLKGVPA